MPCIKYIDRRFSKESQEIIKRVNLFIHEYQRHGLVLTLRQLYYRFVSSGLLQNTERNYKRLGGIVNDGRLAGLIDWEAIEDRGRNLITNAHWDSPQEIIETAAKQYRRDLWATQPKRVEVWVEKQALENVMLQVCRPFDVPVFACKGYVSQSEMWRASKRIDEYCDQETDILYLGDHDPSGVDMTRDVQDRLCTFEAVVAVDRIALNWDQIEYYKPPPNPAKVTDSRFEEYARKYGDESWELDALDPKELSQLVRSEIEARITQDLWNKELDRERKEREVLMRFTKGGK